MDHEVYSYYYALLRSRDADSAIGEAGLPVSAPLVSKMSPPFRVESYMAYLRPSGKAVRAIADCSAWRQLRHNVQL